MHRWHGHLVWKKCLHRGHRVRGLATMLAGHGPDPEPPVQEHGRGGPGTDPAEPGWSFRGFLGSETRHCRDTLTGTFPLEGDGPSYGDGTIRSLEAGISRLLLALGRDWALTVTDDGSRSLSLKGRGGRGTSTA